MLLTNELTNEMLFWFFNTKLDNHVIKMTGQTKQLSFVHVDIIFF